MEKEIQKEVDYCLMVIENARARGNTSCQVPIFAKPETVAKMVELGYKSYQVGFDPTEPYAHVYIKFA
jgi:hypothetical protein